MPATILVCDDEQPLRALVRAAFDGSGHRIVEAIDGNEALALAQSVRPDLVILDVTMPGRSGWEVLAELRADPRLAHLLVLVLTARAQHDDREVALAAGADRYLTKPFSIAELTATVTALLDSRAARPGAGEKGAGPP